MCPVMWLGGGACAPPAERHQTHDQHDHQYLVHMHTPTGAAPGTRELSERIEPALSIRLELVLHHRRLMPSAGPPAADCPPRRPASGDCTAARSRASARRNVG